MAEVQPDTATAVVTSGRRSRTSLRNQSLDAIAASSSNFKGNNEKLPIIGKNHEHGVSCEKFIREVANLT